MQRRDFIAQAALILPLGCAQARPSPQVAATTAIVRAAAPTPSAGPSSAEPAEAVEPPAAQHPELAPVLSEPELQAWTRTRGGMPRGLSRQRCRPLLKLGIPEAEGLLCTEVVPHQNQWDDGSEHYRLWRYDGRRLVEVWRGPRTFNASGSLIQVAITFSPDGAAFTLLRTLPSDCEGLSEAAEQQIEIGDPKIPQTINEICNTAGQYVWSKGRFARAANAWPCTMRLDCVLGNQAWPLFEGGVSDAADIPVHQNPAPTPPAAPGELSRPELEAWSNTHGGATSQLLFSRCRRAQLGVPASDGLICAEFESFTLWRYDGSHLVRVWSGPRLFSIVEGRDSFGLYAHLALDLAADGRSFTISEVVPGACWAEYLAVEKRAERDSYLRSISGVCATPGTYVWTKHQFVKVGQPPPVAARASTTASASELEPSDLAAWTKAHSGVPRDFSKQRCQVARFGIPAADGLICVEKVDKQNAWDDGSEHYRLWRYDGRRLVTVWKGPRTFGSHIAMTLSFAPDGSKLSLLEPRPITCPVMVAAARLAGDKAIWRTVDEICAARGSYGWSKDRFVREQQGCPGCGAQACNDCNDPELVVH